MTSIEKTELGLIFVAAMAVYFFGSELPVQLSLGHAMVWVSVLIFIQSLVRDFYFILSVKVPHSERLEQQCFCLESLVGVNVLLFGFVLLFFQNSAIQNSAIQNSAIQNSVIVPLTSGLWSIAVLSVGVIGFLIKDLVIAWNPIAIRREKNHMNIIVKW